MNDADLTDISGIFMDFPTIFRALGKPHTQEGVRLSLPMLRRQRRLGNHGRDGETHFGLFYVGGTPKFRYPPGNKHIPSIRHFWDMLVPWRYSHLLSCKWVGKTCHDIYDPPSTVHNCLIGRPKIGRSDVCSIFDGKSRHIFPGNMQFKSIQYININQPQENKQQNWSRTLVIQYDGEYVQERFPLCGCWWLELKGQKLDWPSAQGKNWQIRRTKCKILLHWQIKARHQDASGNLKYSEMLHNQPQLHEKLYTSTLTCLQCFQASLLWCLICVAIAFAQLLFRRRLFFNIGQAQKWNCLQRDKQRWIFTPMKSNL